VSVIAMVAGLAFGGAIALLARFFATKVERYDRAAEWAFVVFAACAIPTIATVGPRLPGGGTVSAIVTVVGLAAAAVIGLGELGSSLHVVDFRRIAPAITAAFFAFIGWIGAVSILTVTSGGLPTGLGWLGIVTLVLGVAIIAWIVREPGVLTGKREPRSSQMTAFFVPMIGIVAWMIWLGFSL
jgi:hypothetical protein